MYRKLKRTWSFGYANYIPKFKETFPELSKVDGEELCERFIKLKMNFYYEEETPVKPWIRITLPFALISMIIMIICLPVCFLVTGKWSYPLGKKSIILNWFRSLRLI
ncbi:hypothetical protein ACFS6H_19925 [Terrimonas rubra]|uniref:Uncharacterized protein n=1 Tax=Terrimonas rubra TaxID=1035890 RepID=A0ABW6A9S5_9BACT